MQSGKLRHKVRIEVPVQTKSKSGAVTTDWQLYRLVWASIEQLKGYEKAGMAAIYPAADCKIYMRYIAGVLPTMRIVYNDKIYSILAPPNNIEERNRELEIVCQTGVKAA